MSNKTIVHKKKTKIIFISLLVVVLLTSAVLFFAGNYLYNYALNPKSSINKFSNQKEEETTLLSSENTQSYSEDESYSDVEKKEEEITWLEDYSGHQTIESYDKLKLHAYTLFREENPSHNYVIVVHGYMSQGKNMAYYAKHFFDLGYQVLTPDLRGHGKSEGDYIGMGWHDRLDILKWIDTIIQMDPEAQITLFGISMGASTVMMVSGEESLPKQVKAIVEDCGYTSVQEEFKLQLKEEFKLPAFPILNIASFITKIRAGYTFQEASAIKQVEKCKIPILFIHGDQDTFVPFSMLEPLYQAASCEKEKLVIEGAEHANSADVNPAKYWNTVDAFLEKHFSGK